MGSARPSARRYRELLIECAPAFSAIAAFSAAVTHTLMGVDSRLVFSFLASAIPPSEAVAGTSPEERDGLLSAGTSRIQPKVMQQRKLAMRDCRPTSPVLPSSSFHY